MAKMIQVRNVPDKVHRVLKARASRAGKSLSDYVLDEIEAMVALPSEQDLLIRMQTTEPFAMKSSSASIIRKDRDAA